MGAGTIDVSVLKERIVPVDYGERARGEWVARSFTYADFPSSTDTIDLIDLPASSFIAEMYYVPKVVFNGGTPQLMIGDEDNDDEYIAIDECTEDDVTLVSDMMANDGTGTYALINGRRFYATANHVRVKFDYTGTPTTGEGCVIACIVEVPSY